MAAPEGYKTLGKIGISYKGDYNSNTAYERLDAVLHNGSTYLAIKDAPDGAPRDDKINWIYLAKGFSSDIGDSEITFTEAEARENINTGESVKTIFGKIKKFFADLTAPAFAQMITTKEDLLATKTTGYVPDAKAVADAVTDVTSKLIIDIVEGQKNSVDCPNNGAETLIGTITLPKEGLWLIEIGGYCPIDATNKVTTIQVEHIWRGMASLTNNVFNINTYYICKGKKDINIYITSWESDTVKASTNYDFFALLLK